MLKQTVSRSDEATKSRVEVGSYSVYLPQLAEFGLAVEAKEVKDEKGEFVGVIHFYNTEQGKHAAQLWADGVYNELSVSYYIQDYEIIDDLDGGEYINVKSALLKEVSIVSVGADRDTHEIKTEDEPADEPDTETDEPEGENSTEQGEAETVEDTEEQNATEETTEEILEEITENEDNKRTEAELNALKLEFFKNMV